ncbi:MAG: putative manganese transporter [Oscillospiraceae bacterium]
MNFYHLAFSINAGFTKLHAEAHEEFDALDIILDALIDAAKMIPFLFLAFLLMEFIEHKAGEHLEGILKRTGGGRFIGSAAGALLGCIPQCGFSVAAANFYSGRLITMGTLLAVFISTSDEAIPVLLAHPDKMADILPLIITKIVIAILIGLLVDVIDHMRKSFREEDPDFEDFCSECGCGSHGIWYSAMKHTIKILIFIIIVNLILGFVMGIAGKETIEVLVDKTGFFQPLITAVIGLIPNCAASVLITELYCEGILSFGSAIAGLISSAGIGLAVLFRTNKKMKENFVILGIVLLTAFTAGTIFNLIF